MCCSLIELYKNNVSVSCVGYDPFHEPIGPLGKCSLVGCTVKCQNVVLIDTQTSIYPNQPKK